MNAHAPSVSLCQEDGLFLQALRDGDAKRVARMLADNPLLITARGGADNLRPLELAMHTGHVECAFAILSFCESDSESIFYAMVRALRHVPFVEKVILGKRGAVDARRQDALARSIGAFLPLIEAHGKVARPREQIVMAAAAGNYPAIVELAKTDCNLTATNERGDTALHLAAGAGHLQCVRLLLPGSNPRATNINGDTPLHLAVKGDHVQCARLLLPDSDLLAENGEGNSAIFAAARARSKPCVRLLVENLDPRAPDSMGLTPLMWAARCGWSDLVEALMPLSDVRAIAAHGESAVVAAARAEGPKAGRCVELLAEGSDGDQLARALALLREAGREALYARVEAFSIGAHLCDRLDVPAADGRQAPAATVFDRAGRRCPRRL